MPIDQPTALILRPEPDASTTKEKLVEKGMQCVMAPMLMIIPKTDALQHWLKENKEPIQALLITSRNAIRMVAQISEKRDIPVITVGSDTAVIAKGLGFRDVTVAGDNVEQLTRYTEQSLDPEKGVLLYTSGESISKDIVTPLRKAGFDPKRIVVYEATAVNKLPMDTQEALKQSSIDTVLLFSKRTAETFYALIKQYKLTYQLKNITAISLSQDISDSLNANQFKELLVAESPNHTAMMQTVDRYLANKASSEEEITLTNEKDNVIDDVAATRTPSKHMNNSSSNNPPASPREALTWREHLVPFTLIITILFAGLALYMLYEQQKIQHAFDEQQQQLQAINSDVDSLSARLKEIGTLPLDKTDYQNLIDKINQVNTLAANQASAKQASKDNSLEDAFEAAVIQAQLQEINARVNDLEGTILLRISSSLHQNQLLIALVELREKIASTQPFTEAYETALEAAKQDAMVLSYLNELEPYALSGVHNIQELRSEFTLLIPQMIRASKQQSADDSESHFSNAMHSLITIRKVGDVEGDDTEAIIARAEQALQLGHLEKTVDELAALEGEPAKIIALWYNNASALLKVNQLFETMNAHLIQASKQAQENTESQTEKENEQTVAKPSTDTQNE